MPNLWKLTGPLAIKFYLVMICLFVLASSADAGWLRDRRASRSGGCSSGCTGVTGFSTAAVGGSSCSSGCRIK